MKGILADANIQGQVDALIERMQKEPWKLFWSHLQLTYKRFEDIGLAHSDSDLMVWQACQREELVLITDNRNLDSQESLEMVIREQCKPDSLPVLTISSMRRFRESREYAELVVEKTLEALLRIDSLRGAGRYYIP